MKYTVAVLLCLLIGCTVVVGCGGGTGTASGITANTSNAGTLSFNINWPDTSRVIPRATQSLVITVTFNGNSVGTRTIPRPPAGTNTSSVRFDGLNPGVISIVVNAFPNADGSGVIQATGSATGAIVAGQTTNINIDPNSTVTRLALTPNEFLEGAIGVDCPLTVTAFNAQNAVVLVHPNAFLWSSNNTQIATVDQSGNVRGVSLGNAQVQVIDNESGQVASIAVSIVPRLQITPNNGRVPIGDHLQFFARAVKLGGGAVTWSVQEPNGGSIDSVGLYTAPNIAGTYHIVATSVDNPEISAVVPVIVEAGGGSIIIR